MYATKGANIIMSHNAFEFWNLPIDRLYFPEKPKFYLGQQVLVKQQVKQGEILVPARVVGICSSDPWIYDVIPLFQKSILSEYSFSEWDLEAMM
jgi:hypothetical protein